MNWKILYRYIQGDCTRQELRKLGNWIQEDPANEDFFTSFIEGNNEEEEIQFDSEVKAAWDEFKKNNLEMTPKAIKGTGPSDPLDLSLHRSVERKNKKRRHGIAFWSFSVAAVMLLLFALVFVVRQFSVLDESKSQEKESFQEISTVRGQRSNLKLSDGTKVVLNSSSSLRIPKNYGKETRTVYLDGEAFFEVKHDEQNPFIVVSHHTFTKDLGTKFNVTAYDSSNIEVAVQEGLVSMGNVEKGELQKEIVELTPGKLGVLKSVGGLTVSDIRNMDQYVGWTQGKLAFRGTPFPQVIKRLERWFDIDCKVEASSADLTKRTLTATYNNMPMSEVLKVFSISMDVSYTRLGRTIIFHEGNQVNKNFEQLNTN